MTSPRLYPALDYTSTHDLVADHMRLIRSAALRIARQFDGTLELDDLITLGVEGLLQAAERYQGDKGAKFVTFAYLRIRGQMLDGIPALLPVRRYDAPIWANDTEEAAQTVQVSLKSTALELGDDDAPSAVEQLLTQEAHAALRRAIAELGARERTLIERCYFQDEQLTTAATDLGISKSWASRIQTQTLHTLQARLAA